MFQSRNFPNCELAQVEKILKIDLSAYTKYPTNFIYEPRALEYELYLAEKEKDKTKIAQLKKEIEEGRKKWENSYDQVNEGWTTITQFRASTKIFINKIKQHPHFGELIETPKGWGYRWGNYFSTIPEARKYGKGLVDDLDLLLSQLNCIEKEGIKYVAIWGN